MGNVFWRAGFWFLAICSCSARAIFFRRGKISFTEGGFWYVVSGIPSDELYSAVVARRVGARLAMSVESGAADGPKAMDRLQVANLDHGNSFDEVTTCHLCDSSLRVPRAETRLTVYRAH